MCLSLHPSEDANISFSFVLPKARAIREKYMTRRGREPIDLTTCEASVRRAIVKKECWTDYRGGPERIVRHMFGCLTRWIDFASPFNPPASCSPAQLAKLTAFKQLLGMTIALAFEDTFTVRLRRAHNPENFPGRTPSQIDRQYFNLWKTMTIQRGFRRPPPGSDFPIVAEA